MAMEEIKLTQNVHNEALSADVSDKKKGGKFQPFKKLFGKRKKKDTSICRETPAGKKSHTPQSISNGTFSSDEEDNLRSFNYSMGSRAFSHDSIFIPDGGAESEQTVQAMSQDNILGKVKTLQRQLGKNIKFGQPPPGATPMKKADSGEASLEEEPCLTSPMEIVTQQDIILSDAENKSTDTPSSPSPPSRPGARSEMEEKVAPAKPSRPKRHFSSAGTIESVNLDAIPLAIARLDNSAAKHKLSVKPKKNQRVSKKHRRLGLAWDRPSEQGGLPSQLSLDQNGHPGEDKPTWHEEEPEPLDSEEEKRCQEEYWRELEAKCKRQKAEAAERRRLEEQRLQALERRLWEENRRQEQRGEEAAAAKRREELAKRQEKMGAQGRREAGREPREAPGVGEESRPAPGGRSPLPPQADLAEEAEREHVAPEEQGEDAEQPSAGRKQSPEAEPSAEPQGKRGDAQRQDVRVSGGKQILFPKVNLSPVTPARDAGPAPAPHEPKAPRASPAPHALPASLSIPHTAILVTGAQLCGPAVNLSQIKDTACKSLLGLSEEKKHVDGPAPESPPPSPSPAAQPGPPAVSGQTAAPEHKAANRMPAVQKPALAPKPAGQTPPSSPLCRLSRPHLVELLARRPGKPDLEPSEPCKEGQGDQGGGGPRPPSPPRPEEREAQRGEEEEAERKPAAPPEKPSLAPEAGRKEKPVLQSRHSLDGSKLVEKVETAQPLWITLALQKQKGFREQQATREERKQAREAKQAEKFSKDNVSGSPQPGSSSVSRAGSLHKSTAQPEEKKPETAVSRLERREQLKKANTLPTSVTVEISDSTPPAPLVKEVTKRFSTPDAAPVSTEPAWLALAKRKAKAWSDCPQIIK
ncbi:PREDICTED: uncharacterized protein KIAA1211 homolog [Miniopterus natalensis]|uniref:uncharacterized protein KIAA1211 homolog n=1 Tax=Miniopterus natalensis TaxID=291302 RepID=UPI0007A71A3F|nr:PREDICTED: uncharacterized protein KIAA1211 homolog [Miniopterus natalensis]